MLNKIRTAFTRTPTTTLYTAEELRQIGQTLSNARRRLAEIREMDIEDADRLYRDATDR